MSFSDAISQVDQIIQFEQQLSDPDAVTNSGASSTTSSTTDTDSTASTGSSSFADALAAAQADTEASAASGLTTDDTDTSSDSTDSSDLLGGGDSPSTPEQVRERLEEVAAMVANHLLLNPVSRHAEQLEALAAVAGLA